MPLQPAQIPAIFTDDGFVFIKVRSDDPSGFDWSDGDFFNPGSEPPPEGSRLATLADLMVGSTHLAYLLDLAQHDGFQESA